MKAIFHTLQQKSGQDEGQKVSLGIFHPMGPAGTMRRTQEVAPVFKSVENPHHQRTDIKREKSSYFEQESTEDDISPRLLQNLTIFLRTSLILKLQKLYYTKVCKEQPYFLNVIPNGFLRVYLGERALTAHLNLTIIGHFLG